MKQDKIWFSDAKYINHQLEMNLWPCLVSGRSWIKRLEEKMQINKFTSKSCSKRIWNILYFCELNGKCVNKNHQGFRKWVERQYCQFYFIFNLKSLAQNFFSIFVYVIEKNYISLKAKMWIYTRTEIMVSGIYKVLFLLIYILYNVE